MASFSDLKELHDRLLDPKKLVEFYAGQESKFEKDAIKTLLTLLTKTFFSGGVKGKILIQLAIAPFFQYLFPVCEYFTEIIICGSTDKCISEVEKWRTNAPGAIDCSHAAKAICEFQGNRDAWAEKQDMLQRKIKQVLIYDVSKSNPLSPAALPPADCLFLKHCLECHVTDKEGFCSALKNISSLLKKGGHLIMIACLEQTYYLVESFKFPHLSIEEAFVREALEGGYVIEELEVIPRSVHQLQDVTDYKGVIYVKAQKK